MKLSPQSNTKKPNFTEGLITTLLNKSEDIENE